MVTFVFTSGSGKVPAPGKCIYHIFTTFCTTSWVWCKKNVDNLQDGLRFTENTLKFQITHSWIELQVLYTDYCCLPHFWHGYCNGQNSDHKMQQEGPEQQTDEELNCCRWSFNDLLKRNGWENLPETSMSWSMMMRGLLASMACTRQTSSVHHCGPECLQVSAGTNTSSSANRSPQV